MIMLNIISFKGIGVKISNFGKRVVVLALASMLFGGSLLAENSTGAGSTVGKSKNNLAGIENSLTKESITEKVVDFSAKAFEAIKNNAEVRIKSNSNIVKKNNLLIEEITKKIRSGKKFTKPQLDALVNTRDTLKQLSKELLDSNQGLRDMKAVIVDVDVDVNKKNFKSVLKKIKSLKNYNSTEKLLRTYNTISSVVDNVMIGVDVSKAWVDISESLKGEKNKNKELAGDLATLTVIELALNKKTAIAGKLLGTIGLANDLSKLLIPIVDDMTTVVNNEIGIDFIPNLQEAALIPEGGGIFSIPIAYAAEDDPEYKAYQLIGLYDDIHEQEKRLSIDEQYGIIGEDDKSFLPVPIIPTPKNIISEAYINADDIREYNNDQKVKVATERKIELDRTLAKTDIDVFFLMDNTGSMGGLISSAQSSATAILNAFGTDSRFSKVNVQYGVGAFKGDPTEAGETPTSAYQLFQSITSSKTDTTTAMDRWEASGGGDWEEANFYAIQQVATSGAATPRDGSKATNQDTKWRSTAAKVIIVFGDAPSWQNSVNEKELKDLLKANNITVLFIDTSAINVGSTSTSYSASSGQQMLDAAEEIADYTDGTYTKLLDNSKVKDAVLDAVYDAIATNTWTGGMIARIDSSNIWRKRTPSSVTATLSNSANTFNFTLKQPNQTDSTFSVDTSSGAKVSGKEYYQTSITNASNIFGVNMSSSIAHYNSNKDFIRYMLTDGLNSKVEGYYGERVTSSNLPSNSISSYDMRERIVSPFGSKLSYADSNMKMYINWATGKVMAFQSDASLDTKNGTSLLIGNVDRSDLELEGSYLYKSGRLTSGENSELPRFIEDTQRGNTRLQLFGSNGVNGIGGTFGVGYYQEDETLAQTLSSTMISGFKNTNSLTSSYTPSDNEVWNGFAVGFAVNRSSGNMVVAQNTDSSNVAMTFKSSSGEVKSSISVANGGTNYSYSSDWSDTNAYVNQKAFATTKTIENVPAYATTTMKETDDYSYLAWGEWSSDKDSVAGSSILHASPWMAGQMTTGVDIPKTGSAVYSGVVKGQVYESGNFSSLSGTTNLTADFAGRTLSGTFDNIKRADNTVYTSQATLSNVTWNSNTNSLNGNLAATGMSGTVKGAFFGGSAQEVGGSWTLDKNDASAKAAGIFTGKK